MRNSMSDDSQTLRNFSELLKRRRGAKRMRKFLWMVVLVLISMLVGVWVKTDWAAVTNLGMTLLDKAAAFYHSTI